MPAATPQLLRRARPSHAMALAAVLAALLAGGCGGPAPKKEPKRERQVILSTEYHDQIAGEEGAKQIAAEMGILENAELTELVRKIGQRMVPFAPQHRFDYTYAIVDQAAPNAFALPGGYIYVSRGLLTLVNTEDELACVIGHEITHAAERHAAGRQEAVRRMNPLAMGYLRYGLIQAYGRDQERSADRGGQTIAARAGWDPMGMATFLRDLDAMERLSIGWSRLPSFFASHPTAPERAATAANLAANTAWQRRPGITKDREDFLRRMEGLALGTDPREGVFRGTRFLHPDLDFTLRFPEQWHLANTSQAVGAMSPRGEAQIYLSLAGPGDDPAAAAEHYVNEGELAYARAEVKRSQSIFVGELPAQRLEVEIASPAGKLHGTFTFIPHGGFVYRITAISRAADADDFEGRSRSVVRSFRGLTEEERGSFSTVHLRIVKALGGETLPMLSERTGNALDLPTLAILNDVFVDAALAPDQLMKVGIAEPYRPKRPEVRPDRRLEGGDAAEGAPTDATGEGRG